MKIKLGTKFFVIMLVCFYHNSYGQTDRIYGIATDSGYYKRIIYFDCNTNTDSTVFNLHNSQGNFFPIDFYSASDQFNGRYFIGAGSDTLHGDHIFTFEINSQNLSASAQISNLGDMDYDIFQNRILFRDGDQLNSYDISSGAINLVTTLPHAYGYILGTTRALDPIREQYFCAYSDGVNYHCSLIDLISGSVLHDTIMTSQFVPEMLVYDFVTMKYYSMVNEGDIVSIDPLTANQTYITTILDWNSMLNQEQAVFDYLNGLYIVPYYTNGNQSKLATVNINTNTIMSSVIFPASDFNKLFISLKPIIRKHNNQLTATYGSSYQWYLNGNIINGANMQNYTVTQSGNYNLHETFLNGNGAFSDSLYISTTTTGIQNREDTKAKLFVYPNPFHLTANIDLSGLEGNEFTLNIFNSMGKLERRVNNIKSKNVTIEKQNLNSGLFFFQLENINGIVGKGKFIIE